MSHFVETVLATLITSGALVAFMKYFLDKRLRRHEKRLEQLNAITQTRFSSYHARAVDAIEQTYSRLVDLHTSVFRFCFPDWDADETPIEERKQQASDCMVSFYGFFKKHQIFMEDATAERFDESFRVLQNAFLKGDVPADVRAAGIHVGTSVLADMTETLPGLLEALRSEIKVRIGPGELAAPADHGSAK